MWALLPVGVVAWILSLLHAPEPLLFVVSAIGIIPLAALVGKATEELAYHIGSVAGGLLNVTMGNVPELVIGILALRAGLVTLTQASIIGSVIGNASLVVGMSLFWGGIRNGIQSFNREEVGHHAVLMVLAVASLALPSLFRATAPRGNVEELSVFVACLLMATYLAYMAYDLLGFRGGQGLNRSHSMLDESEEAAEALVTEEGTAEWSIRRSVFWLAAATLGVAVVGEVLVDAVRPVEK
ncbi:MAG TPA: cation transporter, partial [Chloroflexota bacterium]